MSDTFYYVNTGSVGGDGTGGIDVTSGSTAAYATLAACLSARAGTVASGDRVIIECKGSSADTAQATTSGWTVNGELIIRAHSSDRHSGVYNTGTYRLEYNGTGTTLDCTAANITLEYLQIYSPSSGSRTWVDMGNSGTDILRCIFKNDTGGATDTALAVTSSGADGTVAFNIFYGFPRAINDSSGSGGAINVYNNTFANCTTIFPSSKTNNPLFKNNIIYNSTNGITGTVSSSSDYNATDSANFGSGYSTNTNDRVSQTFTFNAAGSNDYHLTSSDTGANDYGVDLSGVTDSTDIDGETISTPWDIGADWLVADQEVSPSSVTSAESFGTATVGTDQEIAPSSITSAESFGTATVALAAAEQDVLPSSIATAESFGTATVAVANTTYYYVNTGSDGNGDGTGGIDVLTGSTCAYASLADCLSANAQTIASGNIVTIKCKGSAADTAQATTSGWTVNGQLIIQADESDQHSGVWNTGTYRLEYAGAGTILDITEPNVALYYLQITDNTTNSRTWIDLGNANVTICRCILKDDTAGASDTGLAITSSAVTGTIAFNIFYGFPRALNDSSGSGGALGYYNNTFANCDTIFDDSKLNPPVFKNNIIYNSTNGITGAVDSSSDYNSTDGASFGTGYTTNTNDRVSQTFGFTSAGSDNYHLTFSDTGALALGTDLSGVTDSIDIDGETVGDTWSIGADYLFAVAPSSITSAESFGTATITVTGVQTISPSSVSSAETFGTATVEVAGEQTVSPSSITSAESFGTATIAVQSTGAVAMAPGIPQPSTRWGGNDPLTMETPADPGAWPSAEAAGYYYIDPTDPASTDSSNTYGYPDKPRKTIPSSSAISPFPAGTLIRIGGVVASTGNNQTEIHVAGTADNHVYIGGTSSSYGFISDEVFIQGSYCTLEYLDFSLPARQVSFRPKSGYLPDHVCMRHCTATGDNSFDGGAVYGVNGTSAGGRPSDIVFYDCSATDFGDYLWGTDDTGNDYHAFKPGAYCDYVWIINCSAARCGGDGIQIGEAAAGINGPTNIFVSYGEYTDFGENSLDVKDSDSVIISGSALKDNDENTAAHAIAVVMHGDVTNCFLIGCDIGNSKNGLGITDGCDGVYIANNRFYGMRRPTSESEDTTTAYVNGQGMYVRSSSNIYVFNNSFYDNQRHVSIQSGTANYVFRNNLFAGRVTSTEFDVYEVGGFDSIVEFSNDLFYRSTGAHFKWEGSEYTSVASWPGAASGCIEQDPNVETNSASSDFLKFIGGTSPAIDTGSSFSTISTAVATTFGTTLLVDYFESTRTENTVDIGYYEESYTIPYVYPSSVSSGETFGTAIVTQDPIDTILPSSITSGETFGTTIVTLGSPPVQTISPPSITTEEGFGTASLTVDVTILPSGITSAENFGTATVTVDTDTNTIVTTSIESDETFGTAVITLDQPEGPVAVPPKFGKPFSSGKKDSKMLEQQMRGRIERENAEVMVLVQLIGNIIL